MDLSSSTYEWPVDLVPEKDDEILRILVATDNHVGFEISDPVRGLDSFNTMEEIFQIARKNSCDMVLFGGDLFHDNRPNALCMLRTQQIFRKYTYGENPVYLKVLSNQQTNFIHSPTNSVNYEDPYISVDLPVFIIHGNHDDPQQNLSAVDLLASQGLVNYFGKVGNLENVKIEPVLLMKGKIQLALYGLGWIRDERLNRMFSKQLIEFLRLPKSTDWFNLLTIHQNRVGGTMLKGSSRNTVSEAMIPDFMDYVVWGHEHECKITPQRTVNSTEDPRDFYVSQPGSSIQTSLDRSESVTKKIGILDLKYTGKPLNENKDQEEEEEEEEENDKGPSKISFALHEITLKSVRPFLFESISLADQPDLQEKDLTDATKKDIIQNILSNKVWSMIQSHRERVGLPLVDRNNIKSNVQDGKINNTTSSSSSSKNDHSQVDLVNRLLELPLVRLKVDYTGFTVLNIQRFALEFVNLVANPTTILLFGKRAPSTRATGKKNNSSSSSSSLGGGNNEDDKNIMEEVGNMVDENEEQLTPQAQIAEIVKLRLESAGDRLKLFPEHMLSEAAELFVIKSQNQAIKEYMDKTIKKMKQRLLVENEGILTGSSSKNDTSLEQKIMKATAEARKAASSKSKSKIGKKKNNYEQEEESEEEDENEYRKKQKSKQSNKKKPSNDDDDDDEPDNISALKEKNVISKKRTVLKNKRGRNSDDDDDDDDDEQEMSDENSNSKKIVMNNNNKGTTTLEKPENSRIEKKRRDDSDDLNDAKKKYKNNNTDISSNKKKISIVKQEMIPGKKVVSTKDNANNSDDIITIDDEDEYDPLSSNNNTKKLEKSKVVVANKKTISNGKNMNVNDSEQDEIEDTSVSPVAKSSNRRVKETQESPALTNKIKRTKKA